jgi:hypothetical protein
MKTFVVYPQVIKRATAYKQLDAGEIWGPLWPFLPRDKAAAFWREPLLHTLKLGETFDDYAKLVAAGYTIESSVLNAGEHYPRIWRTGTAIEQFGESLPRVEDTLFFPSFVRSLQQIEALFESLAQIFRVVHPTEDNLETYGSAIRDLIILACTEVESQWKGVLKANHVPAIGGDYSTKDYVKLYAPMQLNSYELALIRYPDLRATAPLRGWDVNRSTKSLKWYDVYNKVKHDREGNFKEASLQHAIEAVAACATMLAAQYGLAALRRHTLNSLFEFRAIPKWEPKDWYYEPVPGERWSEVDCPV